MPTIRFFTPADKPELYRCFMSAFEGYFVPMQLSEADFDRRLERMGVSLGWSAGVYENGSLLGFILTGIGNFEEHHTAYNAGTGILPKARQRGLAFKLYQWLIRELRENLSIEQFLLEVIEENEAALRLYEKLGFRVSRYLHSYRIRKARFRRPRKRNQIQVINKPLSLELHKPLAQFEPFWGNDFPALERGFRLRDYCLEYLSEGGELRGFLQGEVGSGKIAFWGSTPFDEFDQEVALELFRTFAWLTSASQLVILNIPARADFTRKQLRKWGARNYLNQYEMKLLV